MMEKVLRFESVAAGYGDHHVLKGFSADLVAGDFVGLIGSNGTGKSTLLKCVSGLLPINSGKIEIFGKDTARLKQRERSQMVAVVPQSFDIDYEFTVEDICLMGRNPYHSMMERETEEDFEIVRQALAMTGTLKFKDRLFNALSGGEKQRVIISRAIAQEAPIILLDEPTSALDLHHQIEVMELIAELNRERGTTILAVLHDVNLAARYCGRLIMLEGGQVLADGPPDKVIVESNLDKLYQMKLLVKKNPLFERPEIIPIRVLDNPRQERRAHIHVICGGGAAGKILEEMNYLGHRVSAGVLNEGSDDWLIAKSLGLEVVEESPFTAISAAKQSENLALMREADLILIADVPFGKSNINNLLGLEDMPGILYFHKANYAQDFTGGEVGQRLADISKSKKIFEISDHDEFIQLLESRYGLPGDAPPGDDRMDQG